MQDHAEQNEIWDKSQMGTCSGVLGTVDQLLIDNNIMKGTREYKGTWLLHIMITRRPMTRFTKIG